MFVHPHNFVSSFSSCFIFLIPAFLLSRVAGLAFIHIAVLKEGQQTLA